MSSYCMIHSHDWHPQKKKKKKKKKILSAIAPLFHRCHDENQKTFFFWPKKVKINASLTCDTMYSDIELSNLANRGWNAKRGRKDIAKWNRQPKGRQMIIHFARELSAPSWCCACSCLTLCVHMICGSCTGGMCCFWCGLYTVCH